MAIYPNGKYSLKEDPFYFLCWYSRLGFFEGNKRYYWLPYCFNTFVLLIIQCLSMHQVRNNLVQMTAIGAILVVVLQSSYKLILLNIQKDKVVVMQRTINEDFWDYGIYSKDMHDHLKLRAYNMMKLIRSYLILVFGGVVVYVLFPISEYPEGVKTLPLQLVLPFDHNPLYIYIPLYTYLGTSSFFTMAGITVGDFYTYYFAQHILIQFEILKRMLEGITDGVMEDKDEVERYHSPTFQKEIYRRMSICARQHRILMTFGRQLEEFSTISIGIQMIFLLFLFVTIAYTVVTDHEDLFRVFKLIAYFFGNMLHLALFALHGSELEYNSLRIADSAYAAKWYLGTKPLRTGLTFIQLHAQQPIKFSALGVFDVNNNAMVTMYQTTFSMVTLLQTLEGK